MTRWVAIFTDTPGMLAIRAEREARHLAYLDAHSDRILIGGGLRPAPGEAFCGGLWVLETATRAEAVALIENDPYYVSGLRSYQLLTWGKAFPDRSIPL